MKKGSYSSRDRPSNRLSHGLASLTWEQEKLADAVELARALIGDAPATDEILGVATALALTLILLQAIDIHRRTILSTPTPPRNYEEFLADEDFDGFRQEVIDSGFCEDPPPDSWARDLLLVVKYPDVLAAHKPSIDDIPTLLRSRKRELCRVDEYERKARSRKAKLSNRLDHLIIEEKRRRLKEARGHSPTCDV